MVMLWLPPERTWKERKNSRIMKQLTESDIDQIIREAESNPPSDEWEFCTDQDTYFIREQIRKHGSIKIEEI